MTTINLSDLTETELLELRMKTNEELRDLRGFINTAKTYHAQTGAYYDSQKFQRCQSDIGEKGTLIQHIDIDFKRRKVARTEEFLEIARQKSERLAKRDPVTEMFVKVAHEKLTGEVFSQIMQEAKTRTECEADYPTK